MWSNRQKLHDAEAESARQHLPESTMPWQAPGARVVAVGGSHGDGVGGAVSVGSLWGDNCRVYRGCRHVASSHGEQMHENITLRAPEDFFPTQ